MQVKNQNGTEVDFDVVANLMDVEIRERLHDQLTPCTDREFFSAYEIAHCEKFGEEWELSKVNPTY